MRKRTTKIPIVFRAVTSFEEDLPNPYVYYPSLYGAFIGFGKEPSEMFFCSCMKLAITNFVKVAISSKKDQNDHSNWALTKELPMITSKRIADGVYSIAELPEKLIFKDAICHACLKVIPKYRYGHGMYFGNFRQSYGWYVKAKAFEWGIDEVTGLVKLSEAVPADVMKVYEKLVKPAWDYMQSFKRQTTPYSKAQAIYLKAVRKLSNLIEDEVRVKLGYRKIGEGWVSETQLYFIVKKLFPNEEVVRHFRPSELDNLELDIYLPIRRLGIEYQGQQHFKPIQHWGGDETLATLKGRDKRKEVLCRKNNIHLVKIAYDEKINLDLVKLRLMNSNA